MCVRTYILVENSLEVTGLIPLEWSITAHRRNEGDGYPVQQGAIRYQHISQAVVIVAIVLVIHSQLLSQRHGALVYGKQQAL